MVCMINSIHSHLIARHVQDRIEEATAARTLRAAKQARRRESRLWSRNPDQRHGRIDGAGPVRRPGSVPLAP
jgi:hypothetical protein